MATSSPPLHSNACPILFRLICRASAPWKRQLTIWLGHVQQAIVAAEAVEQRAAREVRHAALPAAGWKVEVQRMLADGRPWRVHHGDCSMGKGRPCTREDARRLLAQGVDSCPYCRPDTALGVPG